MTSSLGQLAPHTPPTFPALKPFPNELLQVKEIFRQTEKHHIQITKRKERSTAKLPYLEQLMERRRK